MENKILNENGTINLQALKNMSPKDKKILSLFACIMIAVIMIMCSDPIVLDIRIADDASTVAETGGYYTFYGYERNVKYYLKDGSHPLYDVTVIYLNRPSENLCDAIQDGNITIDELDRFDIEYGILPQK